MEFENRKQEIVNQITSCGREAYRKAELLPEMLNLQSEVVGVTFNKDHSELGNLRLWDVTKHLRQMNDQYGGVATEALNEFEKHSKIVNNLICAEISGNRGENKAARTLDCLKIPHMVLRNVELCDGIERTEIDDIVITYGGITIVEVKNTSKDIFIDEEGRYYRKGEFLKIDCNIAEKLSAKERLLRKTLESSGINVEKINSIVVFTDCRIEVQNKYPHMKTCFVQTMNSEIESFDREQIFADSDIEKIETVISQASDSNFFPLDFDAMALKESFATVMATLESAANGEHTSSESEIHEQYETFEKAHKSGNNISKTVKPTSANKWSGAKKILSYIGVATVSVLSVLLTETIIHKKDII